MIKKIIQWVKCRIPWTQPPFNFLHGECIVLEQLSPWSQHIKCTACGQEFGINHSAKVVLEWNDIKHEYINGAIENG